MKFIWDSASFASKVLKLKLINMSPSRITYYAARTWDGLPIEVQTALNNLDKIDEMVQS